MPTDVLAGSTALSFAASSTLQIGAAYNGYLDELRLYDTILNGAEMFSSMISSYAESPEPKGYYRFNEGAGSTTFASSVQGLEDLSESEGVGAAIAFASLAVPWEPAVITHVNNIPIKDLSEVRSLFCAATTTTKYRNINNKRPRT